MKKKLTINSISMCAGILAAGATSATEPLILDMVHHNPGEPLYESAYNDPAVIQEMGYNGKVYFLFESPMLAINWESVDPNILPKGTEDRAWVDAKAKVVKGNLARCKALGMKTYAMSDMVLFPKRLLEQEGIEDSFGDVTNPKIQDLIRSQVQEIFAQFENFDGLVVRIGETYLDDAPYHKGAIKDKGSAEKTIIPLMKLLREEICVKRGKTLIFRTWNSFDRNVGTYQRVSDAVEPHPNLIISIKQCEGDFHRGCPFSKVIGMGRHKQIIEVQCAREYEGKGAYPNYIAHGVIEGFEEHERMPEDAISSLREFTEKKPELYAGVWTWSRGGGWDGPYINNEMWPDLNAWVMAQWAADPTQSEKSIFNRYATERLHLKGEDVATFRKLCLLSADAVVRGRNTTHLDMDKWWTRDQGIGWPSAAKTEEGQARSLRQKDESIVMWKEIVDLSKEIQWETLETREHVEGSAYYGLHLYEIYRALVYMSDAQDKDDQESIRTWIKVYDDAWAAYNKLPEQYPSISTLYTQDYDRHIGRAAHSMVQKLSAFINAPEVPLDGALFKVVTLGGMAPNKKSLNPAVIKVLSDERVIGPADGIAWQATGHDLITLANSEWAGFSLDASNGETIDNEKEFEHGYLEFTLRAVSGSKLNCSALTFASARGGESNKRGYALYASVNGAGFNFGDPPVSSIDNETGTRTSPRNVTVDLSGSTYQRIESITFRYYPLTRGKGYTMEFDGLTLLGTVD